MEQAKREKKLKKNRTPYKVFLEQKIMLFFYCLWVLLFSEKVLCYIKDPNTFDYNNFRRGWKCTDVVTALPNETNYPVQLQTMSTANGLFLEARKWTTFHIRDPVGDLKYARNWQEAGQEFGIYIWPSISNKVLIHMSMSLRSPMMPVISQFPGYYPSEDSTRHTYGKKRLRRGLFNCFVNRHIDFHHKKVRHILGTCILTSPIKCIEKSGLSKAFQCLAGSAQPAKCYRWLRHANEKLYYEIIDRLPAVQNVGTQSDIGNCTLPSNLAPFEAGSYYLLRNNSQCHPILNRSRSECFIKEDNNVTIMPCQATCSDGLVVNVELLATNEYEIEVRISVVLTSVQFDQEAFHGPLSSLASNTMDFGYSFADANKESYRKTEYLRSEKVFHISMAEQVSKLWFRWISRNPPCVTDVGIRGPVLIIGKEGERNPSITFDFACEAFIGDKKDQIGWRLQWLAFDVQKPPLQDVWRPRYISINGVRGSTFRFETEKYDLAKCRAKFLLENFPWEIAVCLILMSLMSIFSVLMCCIGKINRRTKLLQLENSIIK